MPTNRLPVAKKPVGRRKSVTLGATRSHSSSLLQSDFLPTPMESPCLNHRPPLQNCVVLHAYQAQRHDEHNLK